MIKCKFIYRFKGGGNSDSLNEEAEMHVLPSKGDTINLKDKESIKPFVVTEVVHHVDSFSGTHEATIYYQGLYEGDE